MAEQTVRMRGLKTNAKLQLFVSEKLAMDV